MFSINILVIQSKNYNFVKIIRSIISLVKFEKLVILIPMTNSFLYLCYPSTLYFKINIKFYTTKITISENLLNFC